MDLDRLKELLAQGGDHLVAADWLTQFEVWKNDLEQALSAKAEALSRAQAVLEEKEQLLEVFHRIGQVTLSSLDLDEVLDNLTEQIVASQLFRSFMVALVDENTGQARIVRTFTRQGGSSRRVARRVEDEDVVAQVVKSGRLEIVQGRGGGAVATERRQEKVFYYLPVLKEGRVLAVLATDSEVGQREAMQRRIMAMGPLVDQVAIAIEHAQTAKKLAQTQVHLIQADKMASLGQLAAGVAHEINNPVGFVGSNLETLREYISTFQALLAAYERWAGASGADREAAARSLDRLRQGREVTYMLQDIGGLLSESREGVDRVTEIVQGLKSFARLDANDLVRADLNEALEETLKIVWNELKYRCEVSRDFGELPPVYCHPGQLKQVFLNLLTNAAQAIEGYGEVRLQTRLVDGKAQIRVEDSGSGMSDEVRRRIFEPFFTTKPVGQGTGLGLAISYGIVLAHRGSIEVDSNPGQGTSFTVSLPLDPDPQDG
jgi:signal transduction histidine kinase